MTRQGLTPAARNAASGLARRMRAVLYLRVSTPGQVNTDYNPEGISIPAQREAGTRKADELNADIVAEFIEPGKSARTIEKRPKFQEMLAWVKAQGDIDYIVVYHFNRVFRNSIDAAITKRDLGKVGVRIISTVLHLDESPESKMIETIMHAVDQYQSEASGADIAYKMSQKVRSGGTVGQTKIGYLNVRAHVDGREIRTVVVDPERGPLVRQAFELFATGRHSGPQLTEIMQAAGLTSRPTPSRPARPLSQSRIYEMLGDRYYLGVVNLDGEEYPGRHEPLIDAELFVRVQRVLALRGGGGTRERKHDHHLKGGLWCARCGRRFILARGQGNGGSYFYFLCRGRQQGVCTMPYLAVDRVSRAVERHYATIQLSAAFREQVRAQLDDALKAELAGLTTVKQRLRDRLAQLDRQEDRYLELLDDPDWPEAKLKQKLAVIRQNRAETERQLRDTTSSLETGRRFFLLALDLLGDPQACYRRANDDLKRRLNRLFFGRLYVDEEGVVADELTDGFRELVQAERPDKPADLGADKSLYDLSPIPGWDGAQVPRPRTWSLTGPGSNNPLWVDVLIAYSNRPELADTVADVLDRIRSGEECAPEEPPAGPIKVRLPQTHTLSDDQVQAIFLCYRAGTGPRELAGRYGVTERTIKYLLKKHGVQQQRAAWRVVTEGRL